MLDRHARRVALLTVVAALSASPALAYIDPNTGGLIYQLLAPLVALALSVWMFFSSTVVAIWRALVRKLTGKAPEEQPKP